ncbi:MULTISPECIES: TetR/AcrR family transcriptional regulator [Streptomyces]|uniref:TetR/AcrR family transcriptional regulator n=1 Tax=Streptomyces TaxID=1883 RepID=UPI000767AEBF|nr:MULTISPECIES: TetR/AcrR family transcriptional regulator [Streptomyces]MBW8093850.1 TetR/AcrR family transcriptional regulator [Streptomyces hygroscopicus subsp. hygroscopicus]MCO8302071.1 TetR/AcrR family transcriptional regulator [Streptomyces sp. RKCA744]MDN3061085.1 TetR/AcrR family transcriptional regulator [Streptomyces sp. SRF1]GLV77166.1 TetR family transcriptional regulator [Streptomyces hygroscopicus subsp. hygroscopicus]
MHLTSPESGPGRRRHGAELEAALLDAAWEELMERGYAALTFAAVAQRAGTSRPVVNRHWPSKDTLVRDAIARASDRFTLIDPDTGSLRDDTIALLEQLNGAFTMFAAAMTAQLAAYFEETGTTPAELRASLIDQRWSLIESVTRRAVERGEIDGAKLTPRIVRLPYDLLRHEVLMHLRPMSSSAIQEIVDTVFLPLVG